MNPMYKQFIEDLRELFLKVWPDLREDAVVVFVHSNPWYSVNGRVTLQKYSFQMEENGLTYEFTAERIRPDSNNGLMTEIVYCLKTASAEGDRIVTIYDPKTV